MKMFLMGSLMDELTCHMAVMFSSVGLTTSHRIHEKETKATSYSTCKQKSLSGAVCDEQQQ